ncbi:MAG: cobalamin-dependent protein [Promethearchaeati archaeon SRVP18_Atabeyarchaeia-1]
MTLESITKMLVELDVDQIGGAVQKELDAGADPQDILAALSKGMNEVGRLYEEMEYFLVELISAGEAMKEAIAALTPHIKSGETGGNGTVVVATVKGDNHDIGKNILISMLMSTGFRIVDLGTDCDGERIVQAVKESGATLVALSALLTTSVKEISLVDKALRDAGLRDKVKIIVGGAPLNMELARAMGADDYAANAVEGVRRIKGWFSAYH